MGVALVAAAAVGYGSAAFFARPAYHAGVDWLTVMVWRFTLAAVLSAGLIAGRPTARAALRRQTPRAVLVTLALGVLLVLHSGTYYAGIETVPIALAGLITAIYPPVTAVLALRFGRPLDGRRAWFALTMAVAGTALAVGGIDTSVMPPVAGLLLVIVAPVFYAFWIILAARHSGETRKGTGAESGNVSDVLATGMLIVTGTAIAYWVIAIIARHPVLPGDVPSAAWPGILGVAFCAGFVGPQAFYAGANRVGAAQAALISTVEPVWTIVAAGIILGEVLTPVQLIGGVLIIAGVVISQTGGSGEPSEQPQLLVHISEE